MTLNHFLSSLYNNEKSFVDKLVCNSPQNGNPKNQQQHKLSVHS
jgi:hypothetical protein